MHLEAEWDLCRITTACPRSGTCLADNQHFSCSPESSSGRNCVLSVCYTGSHWEVQEIRLRSCTGTRFVRQNLNQWVCIFLTRQLCRCTAFNWPCRCELRQHANRMSTHLYINTPIYNQTLSTVHSRNEKTAVFMYMRQWCTAVKAPAWACTWCSEGYTNGCSMRPPAAEGFLQPCRWAQSDARLHHPSYLNDWAQGGRDLDYTWCINVSSYI